MTTQAKLSKSAFKGTAVPCVSHHPRRVVSRMPLDVKLGRRDCLVGLLAGVGSLMATEAAMAAYGEAANVFGKRTDPSRFIPYIGDGFALKIPSKWNPSAERDFPGTVVRYEDNGDNATHFLVISRDSDKGSIQGYGDQAKFLSSTLTPLLGEQVFKGETQSEGGFQPNKVATASLLETDVTQDKNGKSYYTYEILTRSADGDEGGRHVLFAATVSNGKLLILKVQCGDKRWFKGTSKDVKELVDSFTVA